MLVGLLVLSLVSFGRSHYGIPLASAETAHSLKIPFCRRGHGQMSALYIDERTGKRKRGILIFGGDGINYEQPSPGSSFLQDLWILSIAQKTTDATSTSVDQKEYTHSWSRITEESSTSSSNVASLTVTARWPGSRWNFGYTVTEEGWFLIYGGEDATNNVHYDDTWVFYENKWLQLQTFSGPRPHPGPGPGRRKGVSLLLMPVSGLVVLWGGQRPPIGSGKRPRTSYSTDTDGVEMQPKNRGRGRWRGPYVQCLSDTYIFNATAAIKNVITIESSGQSKSIPSERLHNDEWKRVSDFPGACLCGAEAVGIVDPQDGREKLFAFGGRYRANSASVVDSIKGTDAGYLLSDNIWLYDPVDDVWAVIEKDQAHPVNWPEGRDKHAMAFVAELNTVFVSGGRLADPGSDVDDEGVIDIVDMDLWGFDLLTRRWSQYGDVAWSDDDYVFDDIVYPVLTGGRVDDNTVVRSAQTDLGRGSELSVEKGGGNNKWWVGVAGDLPAARYQHGLSVWRGIDGMERPFLVCFGGERSDTPWDVQGTSEERVDFPNSGVIPEVGTGSGQTAIDDDSFSGSGAGGAENDNGGILGPVSSHAQSNDLWLLPLPIGVAMTSFYDDKSDSENEGVLASLVTTGAQKSSGSGSSEDRLLSGGGDSGNRGGSGRKGNIKGDNPRRRKPPTRHANSTAGNSTAAPPSNSSGKTNWTHIGDDNRQNGWSLLSAGGCHYLDDGSQNDRSVDISALAIVGSFALAALAGLLGYQLLKRFLTPQTPKPNTFISKPTVTSNLSNPLQFSTVLQYLPVGIIPMSVGARLRGYTDLTDDSLPYPGSLETAGSLSGASHQSEGSEYSYKESNPHILELREIRN